jgi:nucleoside-diphosphate-sugar epimerase
MDLRGESTKVVVTGATGCIGGRLVEVLAGVRGVKVTALVRNFSTVARIARFGIPLVRADLLEPDSFASALPGADVIFHCGYGHGPDESTGRSMNLDGTLNLAREASRQGVRRFVHVSTMAVYGHELPETVTERTPSRPSTRYGHVKLEIEQALQQLASSSGLELRIVRPTKVFGPYDYNFTVPTIQKMLQGRLWLIENGSGIVSPNYVDNLIQGLLLCAEKDGIDGGVYIMADGISLTWADFYRQFSRFVGAEPCGTVTRVDYEAAISGKRRLPSAKALFQGMLFMNEAEGISRQPLYRFLRNHVPQEMVDRVRGLKATHPARPTLAEYRDYTRRGAFSIARAERELGYRPKLSLGVALDRTEAWLRFAELLPEAGLAEVSSRKRSP